MANYYELKSAYQKIVVTMDPLHYGEHILYLDEMWQYNSTFEFKYHEVIATMPASCAPELNRALVCGGGDGLAVRELLRFDNLEVDLVEIDPEMIRLYQTDRMLTLLNRGSLNNDRCHVFAEDALKFAARQDSGIYDLMILDFPSPGEGNKGKEYQNLLSVENVASFRRMLKRDGILVMQTSIPTNVLVPPVRKMLEDGFEVWNMDSYYDRLNSHDNFTVACRSVLQQQRPLPRGLKLVTEEHLKYGYSGATQIDFEDLEYYRLFEHTEDVEIENWV